jgi:pteridine reductase
LISAFKLAPNFRVNAIAPGLILPPRDKDLNYLLELSKKVPLRTIGDLTQIQNAVEFIINNNFITGQIIYINGGEHL